jgi:hypothetical protein
MTTKVRALILFLCAGWLLEPLLLCADETPPSVEKNVQDLKSEVLALKRDLFVLEEE